jgi:uncharacterized heparinase superfamily protein
LDDGHLEIFDELVGTGTHNLRWSFHLHPSVHAELCDSRSVRLKAAAGEWTLSWNGADLVSSIEQSWFSPSYGVRVPSHAVRLVRDGIEISQNSWTFNLARTA